MANTRVDKILWLRGGCLIPTAMRKTRQEAHAAWFPLADKGTPTCTYRRLRNMLRERGYTVPIEGCIQAKGPRYLWPKLKKQEGTFAVIEVNKPCVRDSGSDGYNNFRLGLKRAVKEVLRYPADIVEMFSTHSLRRGGDTARLLDGMPQDIRMILGDWRCPEVECGYAALSHAQKLAVAGRAQMP